MSTKRSKKKIIRWKTGVARLLVSRTRTFVCVNFDVIGGEEKLPEVEQPRVDVSAVGDDRKHNLQPARCSV